MTDLFRRQLVKGYAINDTTFAQRTNKAITEFFKQLPTSKSATDPMRLGTQSVFISKLRGELLERAGPLEIGVADDPVGFNLMSRKEQLRFQSQCRVDGSNKWVLKLVIMPPNIEQIHMNIADADVLKKLRATIDVGKLRDDVEEVDLPQLMSALFPSLSLETAKWNALVCALLLATGRRTVEVLKTGSIYLGPSDTSSGYSCLFHGQAKDGLFDSVDYQIPLLAPFSLVNAALIKLRAMADTTQLTTEQTNAAYSKGVNNYLKKNANMNPHMLRAVYAISTYQISKSKMTPLGWISKVLGHNTVTNAAYYTRVRVNNCTGPYVNVKPEKVAIIQVKKESDDWISTGAPDNKRIVTMKEIMLHRQKITASSVRTFGGGTMSVIQRVIQNNEKRIDDYNKSLLE